jgi:hypothetical protein
MRYLLLGILFSAVIAVSDAMDGNHRVWIEQAHEAAGSLLICPQLTAGHTARLRYELVSVRSDASGNISMVKQSNVLELKQGQSQTLSNLSLSVNPGDQYTFKLKVYERGQLITEEVVTYPDQ